MQQPANTVLFQMKGRDKQDPSVSMLVDADLSPDQMVDLFVRFMLASTFTEEQVAHALFDWLHDYQEG